MIKRNYFWLLLALVCSLGFTACSDDNDDKGGNDVAGDERIVEEGGKKGVPDDQLTAEERYQSECVSVVLSVMQNLVGLESATPSVVDSVYKPTYGIPFGELVRAVKCDSLSEAEQFFFSIIGLDKDKASQLVTPTPDGYVVSMKDLPILKDGKTFTLGTLTFHRENSGTRFGYVEVDIPCIPSLERIDFLPATAFPDNAGSAYITGDLVYVSGSSGYCSGYYVCVSHTNHGGKLVHMCVNEFGGDETVNFDGDDEGCWIPYNNRHGQTTTFEDCKAYVAFLINEQGKVQNIKYYLDGKLATKKPSRTGKMWHVFPEGFCNDLGVAFHSSDGRAAAIRYNAYYGDYAWVPAYDYRHSQYARVPHDCRYVGNVRDGNFKYVKDSQWDSHYGEMWNYTMNVIHFDDVPISGATLEFSATEKVILENDASQVSKKHLGWVYGSDDRLYETAQKAKAAGSTPLGIIVYVNDDKSDWGNKVTEGFGNALVLSMRSTAWSSWNSQDDVLVDPEDVGETMEFTQYINNSTGMQAAKNDFGAVDKTNYLAALESPAAKSAETHLPAAPKYSSGWFLPTTAQWLAALCSPGLGGKPMPSGGSSLSINTSSGQAVTNIDNRFAYVGGDHQKLLGNNYWTSSAHDEKTGVYINLGNSTFEWSVWYKYANVRLMFAF
jgi:hypothetical protein